MLSDTLVKIDNLPYIKPYGSRLHLCISWNHELHWCQCTVHEVVEVTRLFRNFESPQFTVKNSDGSFNHYLLFNIRFENLGSRNRNNNTVDLHSHRGPREIEMYQKTY